jgi:hypothetical protein
VEEIWIIIFIRTRGGDPHIMEKWFSRRKGESSVEIIPKARD